MHARHFEPTLWIFAFRVRQAVFHAMREKRDLFVVSVNPDSLKQQIDHAFLALHGKRPDEHEMQISKALVQSDGHASLCRALYNSSRFIFIF